MNQQATNASSESAPGSGGSDETHLDGTTSPGYPLTLWIILAGFAISLMFQWNNTFSIAVADGIAYITGGINLVTTGSFINPAGELETWFPPLYPVLIGLFSFGGNFDPVAVGRLICAVSSLWGLVLLWQATYLGTAGRRTAALLATLLLAGNAMYQTYALAVMSHATATAVGLAAFVLWLRASKLATVQQLLGLGLCVGAAFLVRPEAVLVLPLWMMIDGGSWGWRTAFRRTLFSGLGCAVLVLPYVFYLHHVTGRWQLSGKGDVTVAIGRSQFYGGARDYIDPETLEWKYQHHEVTAWSELQRYGFNLTIAGKLCWQTVRGPLGAGLLLLSLLGAWRLAYEHRWRFLLGLLAQLVFLAAVIATWCGDRMLHAAWPVAAILGGIGADYLWQNLRRGNLPAIGKIACLLLLAWAALGWAENATRLPRWSWEEGPGRKVLLRDAGLKFREQLTKEQQPQGAMMEYGATVGYYSGEYRRMMPATNNLETLIKYLQKRDTPHRPAWLALWTVEAGNYHESVREPFLADEMPLPKVFEMSRLGERVVIYQIPPADPAEGEDSP